MLAEGGVGEETGFRVGSVMRARLALERDWRASGLCYDAANGAKPAGQALGGEELQEAGPRVTLRFS